MKHRNIRAVFCVCTAVLLLLSACGKTAAAASAPMGTAVGSAPAAGDGAPMGRWVETKLTMPDTGEETLAFYNAPAVLTDGTLCLYATTAPSANVPLAEMHRLHKYISGDGGATWTKAPCDLNEKAGGLIRQVHVSPNGTLLFHTLGDGTEAGNAGRGVWLQMPDGVLKKIQPEEPFSHPELVSQCGFLNDDVFFLGLPSRPSATGDLPPSAAFFSVATGEKLADIAVQGFDGTPVVGAFGGFLDGLASDGKRLLHLAYTKQGRCLAEIAADGSAKTLFEQLPSAVGAGAGAADSDGNYFFAAQDGIFRVANGGTLVENVVEGSRFVFSLQGYLSQGLCLAPNGDFFVSFSYDAFNKWALYRYHFDETLPAQSADTLTLWSLQDNPTLRAAIVEFSKAAPEISVVYQVVQSGADAALPVEDAVRTLNTELLSGGGPDIIVFDGIDFAPYVQKKMLLNFSAALPKDALAQNICAPFLQGGAYVLPARFCVPVLFGDAGTVESLTTLSALQEAILACPPRKDINIEDTDYYTPLPENARFGLSFLSIQQLTDFALQTSLPALIQDGAVDTAAVREVLCFIKAVSDHFDLKHYRLQQTPNGLAGNGPGGDVVEQWDSSLEFCQTQRAKYGWEQMKTTGLCNNICRYATKEGDGLFDGVHIAANLLVQPGLVPGAYLPNTLVGVSAGSKKQEAALQFLGVLYGEAVQDGFYQDGMPVRQSSLTKMVQRTTDANFSGSKFSMVDKAALLSSLQTPVTVNHAVSTAMSAHADALCRGKETLDAAVTGVQNDLSIYLAERK
ncbi:MAG: hypothetical protein RSD62_07900, partial [Ruthenibacterium sp.]